MALRVLAFLLALLIGIGTLIPLATDYAEAGGKKTRKYKKRKKYWRGVKKYSKRWWQLYRAQERRKKRLRRRRRALRLRRLRAERARAAAMRNKTAPANSVAKVPAKQGPAMLPTGQPAPKGWTLDAQTNNEIQFNVAGSNGQASISVVGPATGDTVTTGRRRSIGGVPTTALRREVINRMIRENGWVVNDFQKQVGGRVVYVVVAQSQARSGQVNSRLFYFAESEGRIYSVATNSPANSAERLAEESEKVIESLPGKSRSLQQAAVKGVVKERPARSGVNRLPISQ